MCHCIALNVSKWFLEIPWHRMSHTHTSFFPESLQVWSVRRSIFWNGCGSSFTDRILFLLPSAFKHWRGCLQSQQSRIWIFVLPQRFLSQQFIYGTVTVFHHTSLLPPLCPSSAVVLNHISSHFLTLLSFVLYSARAVTHHFGHKVPRHFLHYNQYYV